MTKGDKIKVRAQDGGDFPATYTGSGKCRDCDAAMGWIETSKGKKMPVELDPDADGVHEVHWARCPNGKGSGSEPRPASAASSPSLADRVRKLEEAVFGKKAAAAVTEDIPPANDLPFALILAATLAFTLI